MKLNRYLKAAIFTLGFISSFILAELFAYALINSSFTGFFISFSYSLCVGIVVTTVFMYFMNLHLFAIDHASVNEVIKVFILSTATLISNLAFLIFGSSDKMSLSFCIISYLIMLTFSAFIVSFFRIFKTLRYKMLHVKGGAGKRVLIVGAGIAGTTILREILNTDKIDLVPVGFVDDDPTKKGTSILDCKVLGTSDEIIKIAEKTHTDMIIIAIPSSNSKTIKRITNICVDTKCEVKTLPGLYQLIDGQVSFSRLRSVDVEDLLGREPISTNIDEIMGYIENQVVLVTGGGGSIGSELCRQIARHNPKQLIILDIYENNAYEIEQELKRTVPNLNLLTLIASVRDSIKMDDVFKTYRPDIVFHAAAHKHVPLMETSPNEAVKNNILGTYKVVKCADKYGVKKFVQISTDKAVNPTNIMGATKRVCEMIIQAYSRKSKTQFVAVRFGNVLGSNGSVIPLFKKQIAEGGPITVTHKDIIRYFMTIPEAVGLVLQAGAYAKGGEIFVLDMGEQVRIYDLAVNLIKLSGYEPHKDIEIKITGLRPGEKLYEERLMAEEGLQKTANERISIGKPLEIDDDKLFETLEKLYDEAYSESDHMKELVKELVPTYIIDKR